MRPELPDEPDTPTSTTETAEPTAAAKASEAGAGYDKVAIRAVRDHLIFFLGLVPVALAAMRVYLMGQGDIAVILALIKNLDLRELFLATFVRFIGVFGVTTTLYVFCRLVWPRLRRDLPQSPRLGWFAPSMLLLTVVFAASVGCLYPEQFWDTYNSASIGPVDLTRSLIWVALGYLVLRAARALVGRQAFSWGWLRTVARDFCRPEILIVGPAVLFLFWTYLVTNDRMWLPAQVVILKSAPAGLSTTEGGFDPVVHLRDGVAFIGYVVESDDIEETVLRPGGGLVVTRRDNVVDSVLCQYEPDSDEAADLPLITHLSEFRDISPARQNQRCDIVLHNAG